MGVRVQNDDFDIAEEIKHFRKKGGDIGAIVSFIGLVRDHFKGQKIHSMTLEHYLVGDPALSVNADVCQFYTEYDHFEPA